MDTSHTGAALERMAFQGPVVNAFIGEKRPSTEIISLLNHGGKLKEAHTQISLVELLELTRRGKSC